MSLQGEQSSFHNNSYHNLNGSPISTSSLPKNFDETNYASDALDNNNPIYVNENAQPEFEQRPFHVLMLDENNASAGNNRKRKLGFLERRFKTDYLSMRQRAIRDAYSNSESQQSVNEREANDPDERLETWWSGASFVEQALASCCTLHPDDNALSISLSQQKPDGTKAVSRKRNYAPANEIEESEIVAGALSIDKIGKFIGILAMHCHDVGSRALALAILEQTQEADEIDLMDYHSYLSPNENEEGKPITLDPLGSHHVKEEGTEFKQQSDLRNLEGKESLPYELRISHKKPERLTQFLNAGGLKILSQWLVDCSRTVVETTTAVKQPQKSSRKKGQEATANKQQQTVSVRPSPTGPLMLPLLQLLQQFPFDLKAITSSKINKEIRKLFKQIDARIDEEKKSFFDGDDDIVIAELKDAISIKPFTDPIAGGLDVLEVQSALKELMQTWELQAKQEKVFSKYRKNDEPTGKNPFAGVVKAVQSRLSDIELFKQRSKIDKYKTPDWLYNLINVRAQQISKSSAATGKTSSNNSSNTPELARRERENEGAAIMKQDLKKAQEERKKLLLKLREFQQHHLQASSNTSKNTKNNSTNVKWRDGEKSTSKSRSKELLEDVFIFHNDNLTSPDRSSEHSSIKTDTMGDNTYNTDFTDKVNGTASNESTSVISSVDEDEMEELFG